MSAYAREKWRSFRKSFQPWSVFCRHYRRWLSLDRSGHFRGIEWDVTDHSRMNDFPFELKLNLCAQVWSWSEAKKYHILDEKLMS